MRNESRFEIEMRAYAGLQELLAKASAVRADFEAASLGLPAPLARLLGEGDSEGKAVNFTLPPLKSPPRPKEALGDWIWIKTDDLTVQTLVLGVLRKKGVAMTAKEVQSEVMGINPTYHANSILNIGPRLENTIIDRTGGNWRLINESKAPVLHEGYCWGPVDMFQKPEVAAHRRYVILHILRGASDGLMQMQIVRQLDASRLCKAPIEKTLIKMDILHLEKTGEIKRIGRTKKWTVNEKPQ